MEYALHDSIPVARVCNHACGHGGFCDLRTGLSPILGRSLLRRLGWLGLGTLYADFRLLGVFFIQSVAQPIGHRVADDHYCLARRRFQFTRRRRLRVIDGWRWTIAALAGERRQKIAVRRSAIITIRGIAVSPATRRATTPAPTTPAA